MSAIYQSQFIPVSLDGEIDANETLNELGENGWSIVGVMQGSSLNGYDHTLILQRRTIREWDNKLEVYDESEPT